MRFSAFALTVVALLAPVAAHASGEPLPPTSEMVAYHERTSDAGAMLADVNARRSARGLPQLALDPQLCAIARAHAIDMAAREYFGHATPEGESPFERMDRAHYRYAYAGENLALDNDVDSAADALWHSPGHRENILEPHFARIGIAAVLSPEGEIFVEDFSD